MKNYVDHDSNNEADGEDTRELRIANWWIGSTFVGIVALLWAFWP